MTEDEAWAKRRAKDYAYKKRMMENELDIKQGEVWYSVVEKMLVAWYDLKKEVDNLSDQIAELRGCTNDD